MGYGNEDIMDSIIEEFEDFFKIPVLETDHVTISVTKYEELSNGMNSSSDSIGSSDYNYYAMDNVCVIGEETCYFNISNKKTTDNTTVEYVDMSLVPGGYGIYSISYEKDMSGDGVIPDTLKMVFPLEKETTVCAMSLNEKESRLLLFTMESGKKYMRVIHLETMKEIDKILISNDKSANNVNVYAYEDFLVVYMGVEFAVISIEDGSYSHEFTTDMYQELDGRRVYFLQNSAMDFDGERLAVVTDVMDAHTYIENVSKFYLAVYDKSGMLYLGEYGKSLSCNDNLDYYDNCLPTEKNPYKVSWKS